MICLSLLEERKTCCCGKSYLGNEAYFVDSELNSMFCRVCSFYIDKGTGCSRAVPVNANMRDPRKALQMIYK